MKKDNMCRDASWSQNCFRHITQSMSNWAFVSRRITRVNVCVVWCLWLVSIIDCGAIICSLSSESKRYPHTYNYVGKQLRPRVHEYRLDLTLKTQFWTKFPNKTLQQSLRNFSLGRVDVAAAASIHPSIIGLIHLPRKMPFTQLGIRRAKFGH